MNKESLQRFGRQALAVFDAAAEKALTLPQKGRRVTRASDVIGPRAVTDLVTGTITPSFLLILLALVAICLLWFIAKIGLWFFLAAVWAIMLGILYYLRNRIVMSRVAEAMKRREQEQDSPTGEP